MKAHLIQGQRRWLGRWLAAAAAAGILIFCGYMALSRTDVLAQGIVAAGSSTASSEDTAAPTVAIQSADVAATAVSASGSLALIEERSTALGVDGVVENIAVQVGDQVRAGDLILQLDTTDLERAVSQAQLQVDSAKIALADLQTPATDAEIAKAEANLRDAQAKLDDVKAGPSAEEIAAPLVSLPGLAVPLFNRVWRICQHQIEGAERVALGEARRGQRVAADDLAVLDAVQHEVHAGDRGGHVVPLLPVELERPVFAALALHLG